MRRLHAFLEESDKESGRRRCAREMAARMSQSSGRDSADGTADVSTQRTVTQRTASRAQRPRKSVRGAVASDMVSLPQSEVYTVQALMDLVLPRFAGLGDGPRQVHERWAISDVSPASLATSRLDTSGEED